MWSVNFGQSACKQQHMFLTWHFCELLTTWLYMKNYLESIYEFSIFMYLDQFALYMIMMSFLLSHIWSMSYPCFLAKIRLRKVGDALILKQCRFIYLDIFLMRALLHGLLIDPISRLVFTNQLLMRTMYLKRMLLQEK